MAIQQIQSGLLFQEFLDGPELPGGWEAVPADPTRYQMPSRGSTPLGFGVYPGVSPFYLLAPMPNSDFIFEGHFDFQPSSPGENGGLVLFGDAGNQILIQIFSDPADSRIFTWARLVKRGARVEAWGRTETDSWEYLGNAEWRGTGRIGVYRTGAGKVPMNVLELRCYQAPSIQFGNLGPGYRVEAWDTQAATLLQMRADSTNDGWALLDLSGELLPLTRAFRVYDDAGTIIFNQTLTVWGGDNFWRNLTFDLVINGSVLTPDGLTDLQQLHNGVVEHMITLTNTGADPIWPTITLEAAYPDYSQPCDPVGVPEWVQWGNGADWASVALDNAGVPGTYGRQVVLGQIAGGASVNFWLRIDRQPEGWSVQKEPNNRRLKLVVHM